MRTAIATAFAALALTATPAMAEPVAFELRIAYSDLDLTSSDDVTTLRSRIRDAVREACSYSARRSESASIDRACLVNAKQAAFAKVAEKQEAARVALR